MSDADRQKPGDSCPECTLAPFTRNHYFTGKLMQVGDFDAEQRYGVDKLRLHDRILHGWGVACGLKVKQHPQAACQSRMVCVEPGVAVDCCGREIVLAAEDCVDITQLPAIKALIAKNDTNSHDLQICIKYRECPTEEVPVFYDDRGCDADRCAPNRILESYEFDAIVDPKDSGCSANQPKLKRVGTIAVPGVVAVATVTDSPRFLYAISQYQNVLYQIETAHFTAVGQVSLTGVPSALATSSDGTRVFVASQPSTSLTWQLSVFDTSNGLNGAPTYTFALTGVGDRSILSMSVAPDRRLIILGDGGTLSIWPAAIATIGTASPVPDSLFTIGTRPSPLVLSRDGTRGFAADGQTSQIDVATIAAAGGSAVGTPIALPATFAPVGVGIVPHPGGDLLAVIGSSTPAQLALVDPVSGSLINAVNLVQQPQSLAVSPDGRWAYVLEYDTSLTCSIQIIDLTALEQQQVATSGTLFPAETYSGPIASSASGGTLYVPFLTSATIQNAGGIAVIMAGEAGCRGIVWDSLDGCPDCHHPNCLILATIDGYQAGFAIEDQTDPPAVPKTDATNQVARIDNRKCRRILPSVDTLYQLIECVEANVAGVPGPPGPQGPAGPQGPQGNPGQGLEQNLTQIKLPSWTHNGTLTRFPAITRVSNEVGSGVWITFTASVNVASLQQLISPDFVFQVLMRKGTGGIFLDEWKSINGVIFPVTVDTSGNATEVDMTKSPTPTPSSIAFYWNLKQGTELQQGGNQFLVRLRGDFVLDMNGKAVAAQFVRAALPTGWIPSGGPYAIEGGTFESWFQYKSPQSN